jgi:hypothetical protein
VKQRRLGVDRPRRSASKPSALPLSADGTHVNMTVATLIARFNFDHAASRDWLKGKPLKVCHIADVPGALDLERMCFE